MQPWKPILAALAIFSAGLVTGYFLGTSPAPAGGRVALQRGTEGPAQPFLTQLTVADLDARLTLSYDQELQVQAVYDESRERMRQFLEPARLRLHEEQRRLNESIRAVLTDEQARRFEKLPWHRFGRPPGQPHSNGTSPYTVDPFTGHPDGNGSRPTPPLPTPGNRTSSR